MEIDRGLVDDDEALDRWRRDALRGERPQGRRTAGTRIPALWRELGYGDWQDETAAQGLYQVLLARLGPERVGWSAAGFNSVPVPPLPGKPIQLPLSAGQ